MSFQKLFKKADEFSGISRPNPVAQADTSVFDTNLVDTGDDEDEQSTKPSRIKLIDPELSKLRSIIRRVTVQPTQKSTIVKVNQTIKKEATIKQENEFEFRIVPEVCWDDEVQSAMRNSPSDDEEPSSAVSQSITSKTTNITSKTHAVGANLQLVRPQQRVTFEVAPYNCFGDSTVDGEADADPLDVLIPNQVKESLMELIPLQGDAEEEETKTEPEPQPVKPVVEIKPEVVELPDKVIDDIEYALTSKAERDKQRKLEKALRIKGVDVNFDAASSIERSANQRPRDHLPQYRNRASRSLIAALNHCNIATSHKNAKPDLYEVELKYFHRPRMIRERDRPWQIFLKSSNKKSVSSKSVSSSGNSASSGTTAGVNRYAAAEVDKQNLSIASSAAEFILLEYIEEFPPVMLNYGMASAMFNYYRAPENVEEEETTRTKARSESNKLVDSVLSDQNRSRLPRHVMLLLQLRNVKQTYDHDVSVPRLKQGETKVLNGEDDSPFLGKIEEGEIQQSITNNLFRAPIFKHAPHPTDFLLIRTKIAPKTLTYTMREIPHLYLCGQVEPQKIVPRPVQMITQLQEKFYMLAAVRYLQAHFDGADFADLQRNLLKYCLKENSSPHKAQHRAKLKAIVRKVGDEVRDAISGAKWYCKDFGERADAEEAAELERKFSPEEIARTFTPEEVCLQECSNAAEYRLFQQHITDLDLGRVEMWLTHMHRVKQLQMDRAEKAKRLANEFKTSNPALCQAIERFVSVLIAQIKRCDTKLAVGRFLFDRLVVAPWNTTEAYVRSHLERDGAGKMELLGVGDPSGRGEGFSFVRKQHKAGNAAAKKNTVKYFDTDKDLRKLTKKDAVRLLVALGVREAEAMALKRWDRIHMIREFSTKLEKTGLAKELHKYARSGADAAVTSGESFASVAQDIWNRQKRALTNTSTTLTLTSGSSDTALGGKKKDAAGSGSEGEDDDSESDLDFGEHIARSLAARAAATASIEQKQSAHKEQQRKNVEEEKQELSNINSFFSTLGQSSSSSSAAGSSSFAASVSKFGDGALALKKRKVQVGVSEGHDGGTDPTGGISMQFGGNISSSIALHSSHSAQQDDWMRPRRVVKRITRTVLSDGSETVRVEFVFAESEVDRVERAQVRWKKEREARRTATAAGRYGGGAGGAHGEDEEEADDVAPTSMASMKINLGHIKKVVDRNNQMLKKERAAEEQDPYAVIFTSAASKPAKSTKRSAGTIINNRVPRISFAVRLEEELMKLWNNKHAALFRNPVNAFEAPGYYQRVTDPICLSEIREKVVSYQYETADAFVADVAKMVRNAEIYNGPTHFVTTAAGKLLKMLQINLRHDKEHLGAEHDTIGIMEDAVKRKKVYLRKNVFEAHSSVNPAAAGAAVGRSSTVAL